MDKERFLKKEMILAGSRLYQRGLVVAKSGNLSARLDTKHILITASGAILGRLKNKDIIKVDLGTLKYTSKRRPSSELPLHSLVHRNFPGKLIIHCHPPLINAYFSVYDTLKVLTFETGLYLKYLPVIAQNTPTVAKPALVVAALKSNNQAVLKNHGVITIADNFEDALGLVEALEEAVRVAAVARIFKKGALDKLDKALKISLAKSGPPRIS
ncbi:MAG TPA: class II aldolase/adducin family protein [Candidatus Margulisiibacteriota bacterium]|nr:class II aldolase/adducin family protein [Candidatus Margulisiibacteriota bacterium]